MPGGERSNRFCAAATLPRARASVARYASRAQRDFMGIGHWRTVARTASEISAVPDLPPPSAVGTRAQAGADLAGPSQGVRGPRETSTGGGFYRRLLTGQKSGLAIGPTKRAKGRKSSLSPSMAVFLSPLVSKALPPT